MLPAADSPAGRAFLAALLHRLPHGVLCGFPAALQARHRERSMIMGRSRRYLPLTTHDHEFTELALVRLLFMRHHWDRAQAFAVGELKSSWTFSRGHQCRQTRA